MKKPNDAAGRAKGGGSTRNRRAIYGERKTISLRMAPELNERMILHCDNVHTVANTYVTGLIESALSDPDPAAKTLIRPSPRSETKVVVSVRMDPALHERLNAYSKTASFSANAFVNGLIEKDLWLRGV